jgi:hypothetical protein
MEIPQRRLTGAVPRCSQVVPSLFPVQLSLSAAKITSVPGLPGPAGVRVRTNCSAVPNTPPIGNKGNSGNPSLTQKLSGGTKRERVVEQARHRVEF